MASSWLWMASAWPRRPWVARRATRRATKAPILILLPHPIPLPPGALASETYVHNNTGPYTYSETVAKWTKYVHPVYVLPVYFLYTFFSARDHLWSSGRNLVYTSSQYNSVFVHMYVYRTSKYGARKYIGTYRTLIQYKYRARKSKYIHTLVQYK